jgi:hypothetical protein
MLAKILSVLVGIPFELHCEHEYIDPFECRP